MNTITISPFIEYTHEEWLPNSVVVLPSKEAEAVMKQELGKQAQWDTNKMVEQLLKAEHTTHKFQREYMLDWCEPEDKN